MNQIILVCYASVSGSTGEVAEAIGDVLRQEDTAVTVLPVEEVTDVRAYSAVVVGSSIRVGRWLPQAIRFLETEQTLLANVPVAYFTTCLTMINDTAESRRIVLGYMEPLLHLAPQIEPVGIGLFSGSLDPERRQVIPGDIGPQGDYRDWDAIRAWAAEIRPALLTGKVKPSKPMVLSGAVLSYTDMSGIDLSQVDLQGAELEKSKLVATTLQGANLEQSTLINSDLEAADLADAGLNWANLNQSNLLRANLQSANLIGAELKEANLREANLSKAILNGASLQKANLAHANLSKADLNWADLSGADLSGADLSEARLGWATLSHTNLGSANLKRSLYNDQTRWPNDFSPEAAGCILVQDGM